MASVLVPVAYIIIVFGTLFIISYYYRKSAASRILEPYFPSHPERNTYVTLLQKTDPPTPEVVLKSALVRRAIADVLRVMRSVGDDLWNSFLAAEKEMEAEIVEVMAEANSFVEGWGPVIFQTANEMIANEKIRGAFEYTIDKRTELDMAKRQRICLPWPWLPFTVTMTPSNSSAPQVPRVPSGAPAPSSQPRNGLTPTTPATPVTPGVDSAVSSDAEGPQSPGTPQSKSVRS
ncbi:hypothetical protein BT96DRAFT_1019638 [Gymnopus androsaceus JB14]|uniref:Translocation protein sec66 n=1 Tax=Gymnopus androsaceus JB14 TaxID=1447944 RepID=A0A6A4HKD0_9AGAR|nr:hypothetical protein BT96DRAFT_1019638 [Gymnopus androsaceus JB14]